MLNDPASSPVQLNELDWEHIDDSANPQDFATYLQNMEFSKIARQLRDYLFELLPISNTSHILDAGCGLGAHSRALAKIMGSGGSVTGIDKSRMMIEKAEALPVEEGSAQLMFNCGDLCELPYADESFDAVFTDRVFIHLSKPEKALSELRRVLKPGGHIAMSESDWSALDIKPSSETMRLLVEEKKSSFQNPTFGCDMAEHLKKAGFSVLRHKAIFHSNTQYDLSWKVMNLEGAGHRLIEKGVMSADAYATLKASLHEAEEAEELSIEGAMYFGLAQKEERL